MNDLLIRFEDEFPEEAETLMKICSDKKYREKIQWDERSVKREVPKVGRNELCPCGSGKKYKKCCL